MRTRAGRAVLPSLPLLVASIVTAALPAAPAAAGWVQTTGKFRAHYQERLGPVEVAVTPLPGGGEQVEIVSDKLKGPGNRPVLLLHPERRPDAIVLIHGLTDSPHYVRAIADAFFAEGVNVVLPLLPAHGLVDPDAAMEDGELAQKWKRAADHAVEVATDLGDRVSMGGFSTGGALSVNTALRRPLLVSGGLFLFSAALSVGRMNELAGRSALILPRIAKAQDGEYAGIGPNPYKYPRFTQYGGLELTKVIRETKGMLAEKGPAQPIFAVHSIDDVAALPSGIGELLRAEGTVGVAIVLSSKPETDHGTLVLAKDIPIDASLAEEWESPKAPRGNPAFEGMMDLAISFFRKNVQGTPAFAAP